MFIIIDRCLCDVETTFPKTFNFWDKKNTVVDVKTQIVVIGNQSFRQKLPLLVIEIDVFILRSIWRINGFNKLKNQNWLDDLSQ